METFQARKGATMNWPNYHVGAVYTVELGCLIQNGFDIGLQDYPIFDESYRDQLNRKIVEHYWFREIGAETPQLFKLFINRKMNEVMPYFNQLYMTDLEKLGVDPLANLTQNREGWRDSAHDEERNTDRNDTYKEDRSESADTATTSNSTSDARTVNSATPQMQLSGREDYATSLVDADSTAKTTGDTKATSTATANNTTDVNELAKMNAADTEKYAERLSGLVGMTGAEALRQYRDAILNVDMMVIYALESCFMGLWKPEIGSFPFNWR